MQPEFLGYSPAFKEIERLADLTVGWDSYGASRIEKAALERATHCLATIERLLGEAYARPVVGPTPEAGVQFVWRSPRLGELEALFSPTGARFVVLGPERRVVQQDQIADYQEFATQVLKRFVAA